MNAANKLQHAVNCLTSYILLNGGRVQEVEPMAWDHKVLNRTLQVSSKDGSKTWTVDVRVDERTEPRVFYQGHSCGGFTIQTFPWHLPLE